MSGLRGRNIRRRRRGLTLAEVLATVLIVAIVLPAAMNAITSATEMAGQTRHRAEATSLAETKLAELLVSSDWQGGAATGEFGPDWPGYTWEAQTEAWEEAGLQQLHVRVKWEYAREQREAVVSTLVYTPETETATSGAAR